MNRSNCTNLKQGSPPRVRGKPRLLAISKVSHGITPACAGKTLIIASNMRLFWDHPRVCGENELEIFEVSPCTGSPPRVRGKLDVYDAGNPSPGITPACAGKTLTLRLCMNQAWDHPRVCGENKHDHPIQELIAGSPPRVRGKPKIVVASKLSFRITPACVGKT